MKSKKTSSFDKLFNNLPLDIQETAKEKFKLFKQNPNHPSLRKKIIMSTKTGIRIFEVSITSSYRATFFIDHDTCIWFWIGTHQSFDKKF